MDRAALIEDLKRLIIAECDIEMSPDEIDADARLIGGDLDLDSLDALQIALAVTERHGVRIEGGPDERKAFASVSSLADFVIARKAAPSP
jgi:acyl carrier protein